MILLVLLKNNQKLQARQLRSTFAVKIKQTCLYASNHNKKNPTLAVFYDGST